MSLKEPLKYMLEIFLGLLRCLHTPVYSICHPAGTYCRIETNNLLKTTTFARHAQLDLKICVYHLEYMKSDNPILALLFPKHPQNLVDYAINLILIEIAMCTVILNSDNKH